MTPLDDRYESTCYRCQHRVGQHIERQGCDICACTVEPGSFVEDGRPAS